MVYLCNLNKDSYLLEIGPGTGQATLPLAKKGFTILGIELGDELTKIARQNLSLFPNVKIITGAFEKVDLPLHSFNVVYAATAFHWIDPKVKFLKPFQLLKPFGFLVQINTHHIDHPSGNTFFEASQGLYKAYFPNIGTKSYRLPKREEVQASVFDKKYFEPHYFNTYFQQFEYQAKAYVQLLDTFSSTIALPNPIRKQFLQAMEDLINEKFNGSITKTVLFSLSIGKRI